MGSHKLPPMRVIVNGEARQLEAGTTVSQLLELVYAEDGPVAVERNRIIVPRAEHGHTSLNDGDEVEVVQFVGGG